MIVAVGYLASLLLAISLIVTNALKFRIYNILGCLTFIVYGILITAFPVILANSILLVINIYQLYKLYNSTEVFEMVTITPNNEVAQKFLSYYGSDILKFFPNAKLDLHENNFCFMVLRNMALANLFMGNKKDNGVVEVTIDYTIPTYRDFKIGSFIFNKGKNYLLEKGVNELVYTQQLHPVHQKFLLKMGFSQLNNTYAKKLF